MSVLLLEAAWPRLSSTCAGAVRPAQPPKRPSRRHLVGALLLFSHCWRFEAMLGTKDNFNARRCRRDWSSAREPTIVERPRQIVACKEKALRRGPRATTADRSKRHQQSCRRQKGCLGCEDSNWRKQAARDIGARRQTCTALRTRPAFPNTRR